MTMRVGPALLLLVARAALAAPTGDVRVLEVQGEVELMPGGDETRSVALRGGETVSETDRIYTSMDGRARLQFADNSEVIIQELTDMKIGTFREEGDKITTRLWLKAGEIAATVNKKRVLNSDFQVKTPTATAGVRGTTLLAFASGRFTRFFLSNGWGFGQGSKRGSRTNIEDGKKTETLDDGELENPLHMDKQDAEVDATAQGDTQQEDQASDEGSLGDPDAVGFNNTSGQPATGGTIQTAQTQATSSPTDSANLIRDGIFNQGIGGSAPWQLEFASPPPSSATTVNSLGGVSMPPGGSGPPTALLYVKNPFATPSNVNSEITQDFNFQQAGPHTLSLNYNVVHTGGMSGGSINFHTRIDNEMDQNIFPASGEQTIATNANLVTSAFPLPSPFMTPSGASTGPQTFTQSFNVPAAGAVEIILHLQGFLNNGEEAGAFIDDVKITSGN